jgi:hypothetical protein
VLLLWDVFVCAPLEAKQKSSFEEFEYFIEEFEYLEKHNFLF